MQLSWKNSVYNQMLTQRKSSCNYKIWEGIIYKLMLHFKLFINFKTLVILIYVKIYKLFNMLFTISNIQIVFLVV